jgi:hypothetical protein
LNTRLWRTFSSFVLIACVGAAGIACSGSSSSAPSAGDVNLVIGGLATAFPGSSCTRDSPGTRGASGTTLSLTFTYSTSQGNLTGGNVQVVRAYNTGDSETQNFAIPSASLTMSGTTFGTIRVDACPRYNDATVSKESLTLFDAAGHSSNTLTVSVTKPAGAL